MSLALWPQVVSQAPQHFRSSEKQATSEGCLACQSVCSVISLHSGMSRAVHPKEFWKVDVEDVQRVHQAVYMLSTRDYNAALSHRQTPRKQNYTSAQYHTLQDPNRQTPRRQNHTSAHRHTKQEPNRPNPMKTASQVMQSFLRWCRWCIHERFDVYE